MLPCMSINHTRGLLSPTVAIDLIIGTRLHASVSADNARHNPAKVLAPGTCTCRGPEPDLDSAHALPKAKGKVQDKGAEKQPSAFEQMLAGGLPSLPAAGMAWEAGAGTTTEKIVRVQFWTFYDSNAQTLLGGVRAAAVCRLGVQAGRWCRPDWQDGA